jgi:hypothetical protein
MKRVVSVTLILFLISACNYRTSSKHRFEKACAIKLPTKFEVIRDEYQDMFQDYVIYYTLKLDSLSMLDLTTSIRDSKYYNKKFCSSSHDIPYEVVEARTEAFWIRTSDGYLFGTSDLRHSFSATIDTVASTAEFIESSD